MKVTALYDTHLAAGARMVAFAGFQMPLCYSSISEEHLAVRQNVGLFDVSHMGEFIVRGPQALDFLETITTNDVRRLQIGDVQYTCMTQEDGGIVDDLLLYRLQEQSYMMVVNAGNIEKDWAWINTHRPAGVELRNISDQAGLLAVQGPKAIEVLQPLTKTDLRQVAYYKFARTEFGGVKNVLLSNTGYTGAGGFEIYFEILHADSLWKQILEVGRPWNIKPAGLGARDTLRLEMGYRLYGQDISEQTTPLEAGLQWLVSFTKNFIGRPALEAQKQAGILRKFIGLCMEDKGIARSGYAIVNDQGHNIGHITSGGFSPSLQKAIALGYVSAAESRTGSTLGVVIRGAVHKARIVKVPFLESLVHA